MGGGFNPVESIEKIVNNMESTTKVVTNEAGNLTFVSPLAKSGPTYFIGYQTPIEETRFWESFCYRQMRETRIDCLNATRGSDVRNKIKYTHRDFPKKIKIIKCFYGVMSHLEEEDIEAIKKAHFVEINGLHQRILRQGETYDQLNMIISERDKEIMFLKGKIAKPGLNRECTNPYCDYEHRFKNLLQINKHNQEIDEYLRILRKEQVERYQELNNLHSAKYPLHPCSNSLAHLGARLGYSRVNLADLFQTRHLRSFKWQRILESWMSSGLYPSFEPRGIKSSPESPASNPSSTAAASVSEDGPGNTSSNNSKSESDGTNGKSSVSVKSSAGYCVCESCSQFQD